MPRGGQGQEGTKAKRGQGHGVAKAKGVTKFRGQGQEGVSQGGQVGGGNGQWGQGGEGQGQGDHG